MSKQLNPSMVEGARYRSIRATQDYIYVDIQLEFLSSATREFELTSREFKFVILSALKSLHGDLGASIPFDVLKYRDKDCRAFVRTSAKDLVRFQSALTFLSSWKERSCCFTFHKISHSLSSLPIQSSHQKHLVID